MKKWSDRNLSSLTVIAIALLAGGIIMWVVDAWTSRFEPNTIHVEAMSFGQAIWIGLWQSLSAIFPGTSRSMSTIAAGQLVGMDRPTANTGAGMASGRPCVTELNVMKPMDSASTKLMAAVVSGQNVGKAKLTLVKTSTEAPLGFFTLDMANVQVGSLQVSGSSELPTEAVALRFQSVTATFTPQKPDGSAGTPVPVAIKAGTC